MTKISEDVRSKVWEAIWEYVEGRLGVNDVIRVVLSAVVNYDQQLPEETGRAVWAEPGDEDHIYDWVADVIESGARTFIALSPESHRDPRP